MSRYRIGVVGLCLLVLAQVLPAYGSDGYKRVDGLDIKHYRIEVTLDREDSVISGTTVITASIGAGDFGEIPLDFGNMIVDQILVDQKAAKYDHSNGKLRIQLSGDQKIPGILEFSISYHGQPTNGLFIMRNKFGDRTIFADNFSNRAHHWFPGIDHPYDKATVEFIITAPDTYDVIANGRLHETTNLQDGTRKTHWKTEAEIPTYCMVIGATEFSILHAGTWNGIPVQYYLYPQDRDNGVTDFERSINMLEFYSSLIGPYPYTKLALVQSTTRYGGMENASSIFFSEKSIRGNKRGEGTVAHELAHQWFGDSITEADWHDVWLSEGFATYFGALFFERTEGWDRFQELMNRSRERYLRANNNAPGPIHDTTITDLSSVLTSLHYVKGGWTLHMLRGVMGDSAFFEGIKEYYRKYRDRNATTSDFMDVMTSHAGQPLDWFFQQWIYEPGHPVYELDWQWNADAKEVNIIIRQTQDGLTFRMPVDLAVHTDGEVVSKRVNNSAREQRISIPMNASPDRVVLDPDNWILKESLSK